MIAGEVAPQSGRTIPSIPSLGRVKALVTMPPKASRHNTF